MTLYYYDRSSFCPMDNALLEKEGEITLAVYRCPSCGMRFAKITRQELDEPVSEISYGFVKPKEVYKRTMNASQPARVLSVTIPAGAWGM